MSQQITNAETIPIDHPVHKDWMAVNLSPLDPGHEQENVQRVRERFDWTDEDPYDIWRAIDAGVHRTIVHRYSQETSNRDRLITRSELDRMNQDPSEEPKYVADTIREYRDLAGRNDSLPQYVSWFGRTALTAFEHTDTYGHFDSITLELAGVGQAGDWGTTTQLDQIIDGLPSRLQTTDKSLKVTTFNTGEQARYTFDPLRIDDDDSYSFQFGVVRRRRPVADVNRQNVPGGKVRIFKQSVGVVVLGLLPEADQGIIQQAFADHAGSANGRQEAAAAAGEAFERAIKERSDATEVVPLGVQYLMKARRRPIQRRS
jgi:hypothetical protein